MVCPCPGKNGGFLNLSSNKSVLFDEYHQHEDGLQHTVDLEHQDTAEVEAAVRDVQVVQEHHQDQHLEQVAD